MIKSLDMFTSGQVPSLEHSLHLARFIANDLKTWNNLVQPGKLAVSKRDVAIDALSQTLFKIGACVINSAGDVLEAATSVAPALRGRRNLPAINEAWRSSTALATGILQAMCLIADKKGGVGIVGELERKTLQDKIGKLA